MEPSSAPSALIADALARITDAWRSHQPQLMAPLLDDNIVMVFPEFSGRLKGRQPFIESFVAFDREASVLEYAQRELNVDEASDVGVAQYRFDMVYERAEARWRSTGWDVWVFHRRDQGWLAVWRTMQALREEPA
jgi:hypothetical protein